MSEPYHIIIPARLRSSRLPGKLLMTVAGRSILEYVYRQVELASAQSITIATDSEQLQQLALGFGANVVMTDMHHVSGTDRVAEAARVLGLPHDAVIVNVQGDEPQIPPELVHQVAQVISNDWASLYWPIDNIDDYLNPNVVKVVLDDKQRALYFSRSPIPFNREYHQTLPKSYKHIGLYAYRMQSLQRWVQAPPSSLEKYESLEQLRTLSLGMQIQMQQACCAPGQDINILDDFQRFEAMV